MSRSIVSGRPGSNCPSAQGEGVLSASAVLCVVAIVGAPIAYDVFEEPARTLLPDRSFFSPLRRDRSSFTAPGPEQELFEMKRGLYQPKQQMAMILEWAPIPEASKNWRFAMAWRCSRFYPVGDIVGALAGKDRCRRLLEAMVWPNRRFALPVTADARSPWPHPVVR
jgi:hypothetical protein